VILGARCDWQTVVVEGADVVLQIWDTAGQERFRALARGYYRNADGVVLVFDLTSRSSFEALGPWMRDLQKSAAKGLPVIVVGNKADAVDDRAVSGTEAESTAREFGAEYRETSCKTGDGVAAVFQTMARLCYLRKFGAVSPGGRAEEEEEGRGGKEEVPRGTVDVKKKEAKGGCCK
jgi:small GTP-binding protein